MPTYRVSPVNENEFPGQMHCALTCEQCRESLGVVATAADLDGVCAEVILALWPEMDSLVKRHETYCLANGRH